MKVDEKFWEDLVPRMLKAPWLLRRFLSEPQVLRLTFIFLRRYIKKAIKDGDPWKQTEYYWFATTLKKAMKTNTMFTDPESVKLIKTHIMLIKEPPDTDIPY